MNENKLDENEKHCLEILKFLSDKLEDLELSIKMFMLSNITAYLLTRTINTCVTNNINPNMVQEILNRAVDNSFLRKCIECQEEEVKMSENKSTTVH